MSTSRWAVVVVAVLIGMVLGAAVQPQVTGRAMAAATPAQNAGRYQMFMSPTWHSDLFMVDTATGRIWRCVTTKGDMDEFVWQQEGYAKASSEAKRLAEDGVRSTP